MAGFIEFAKTKLIDGVIANTDLAFIAAGSSRFWLAPTTTIETEILIRQHMATFVSVSIDRTIIEARYLSEPIIAAAAMTFMLNDNHFLSVISAISKFLYSGILQTSGGKGEVGELVACIILCRGFDSASKNLSFYDTNKYNYQISFDQGERTKKDPVGDRIYAHPIPLICFLEQLYSKPNFQLILSAIKVKSEVFFRSFVYFTHFVKVKNKIVKEDLDKYLQRGVAIICETGEKGFDIYIPFVISKVGKNLDIFDSESYTISTKLGIGTKI
jgi:hypothetical protein